MTLPPFGALAERGAGEERSNTLLPQAVNAPRVVFSTMSSVVSQVYGTLGKNDRRRRSGGRRGGTGRVGGMNVSGVSHSDSGLGKGIGERLAVFLRVGRAGVGARLPGRGASKSSGLAN